jgi:STE24 endopeptidase
VDLLKGIVLGAVLGGPILALVFWIYDKAGPWWWLWAFAAVFGFEFLMAAIYPTFLAPIFNKFTPLPEGSLKQAITDLAQKIRFKMAGIFTIDGSRRSAHSNAYFAGMGRMRRIVLFDTLQKQLTEREIIAVLGHEMGHNKLRHIHKQLILSFFVSLTGFWILSLAMGWTPFFAAFGAGDPAPHKALVLFALFSAHFTFFLPAITNALSRRYEYQADRFSVDVVGDREAMSSALVALCRENLSNLTPHPLYSFYHYTHPTTLERVRALET